MGAVADHFATWTAAGLVVRLCCVFSFVWIVVTTFAPAPHGLLEYRPYLTSNSTDNSTDSNSTDGGGRWGLCPRETVCAEEWYTLALLAVSRSSAYLNYPLMMLLFLSKANHLRTLLQQTYLSIYIPFYDLHAIHTLAGHIVALDYALHSVCHMVRWALQGNARLLLTHPTGVSGLICFVLIPIITVPLSVAYVKKRMAWEWRKGLHYLSIVWGITICFHAPLMDIAWLMGVPVGMYLADLLLGSIWRTYRVDTSIFYRLENGVELTFEHPPGFQWHGAGYVLVCLPWISPYQWHAFSVFAHSTKPNHACVCMSAVGDWTKKLHACVQEPTRRPAWISGPFASPYSTAGEYDNLILVASGIGITPALSLITTYKEKRRVNLIWSCRDASLVEFYLDKCQFSADGWTLIFYTGKRQLELPRALPPTVLIFSGRPDLPHAIQEIIVGVETGVGLPEDLLLDAERLEADLLVRTYRRAVANETKSNDHLLLPILEGGRFTEVMIEARAPPPPTVPPPPTAPRKQRSQLADEDHASLWQDSSFGEGEVEGDAVLEGQPISPPAERPTLARDRVEDGQRVANSLTWPEGKRPSTFVRRIDQARLAAWQMLYCGGSQPLVEALRGIERDYRVRLRVEKFDW